MTFSLEMHLFAAGKISNNCWANIFEILFMDSAKVAFNFQIPNGRFWCMLSGRYPQKYESGKFKSGELDESVVNLDLKKSKLLFEARYSSNLLEPLICLNCIPFFPCLLNSFYLLKTSLHML